jgi:hypothetical protein
LTEKSLPKGLIENLDPGEEVLYAVKKRFALEKPKWLIVTNRRVIYFDEKIMGRYSMKATPFEKIEKVVYHGGITSSQFTIHIEDGSKIELSWMDKEESKKAITALYNAIKNIAIEPPTLEKKKNVLSEEWILLKPKEFIVRSSAVYTQILQREGEQAVKEDPFTLLKKLKELRDMGIISEEEYSEKKKKILEKI